MGASLSLLCPNPSSTLSASPTKKGHKKKKKKKKKKKRGKDQLSVT
jgi:hypothetical protein